MIRYAWLLIIGTVFAGVPPLASGQDSETLARGARLWNATCNRCHNRRSPTERTDDQWDVIVSHMRTRANLTETEAQAIAAFLKQVNRSENQKSKPKGGHSPPDSTAAVRSGAIPSGSEGPTGEIHGSRTLPLRAAEFPVLGRLLWKRFLQTKSSDQQDRSH